MIVDLKNIKYYFLTTGQDDQRRNHILTIFQKFDITEINPVMGINRYQSGSIGMSRMIDRGLRDQDRTKSFQPFVIMEDDVSFYREFPENLEIPDESDMLFIGISKCGLLNGKDSEKIFAKNVKVGDSKEEIVRIYNMLTCHGIMICSASGANAFQRAVSEGFYSKWHWDLPVAAIQPYYKVYALKKPLVFQDAKYKGCQIATKFELAKYEDFDEKQLVNNNVSIIMSSIQKFKNQLQ